MSALNLALLAPTRSVLSAAVTGMAAGYLITRSLFRRESVEGKVVLITGGSRGLGLELARFALAGRARVAICGRDPVTLERARKELVHRGEVLAVPCDVTERGEAEELIFAVEQRLGPIDVLINNAGVIQVGPQSAMTLDDYQQSIDTHFWGPLHLVRRVLPSMERRGRGWIVNITSIGGRISVPHLLPYSASKYALVGLSRGLRAELRGKNISVTTVTPGLMRTGSPRNATFVGNASAEYAWFRLGDSLPLLSMRAPAAARKILRDALRGKAEVRLDLKTRLATLGAELFPNLTEAMLAFVHERLPSDPGALRKRATGAEAGAPRGTRWMTWLTSRAELRNNELAS